MRYLLLIEIETEETPAELWLQFRWSGFATDKKRKIKNYVTKIREELSKDEIIMAGLGNEQKHT